MERINQSLVWCPTREFSMSYHLLGLIMLPQCTVALLSLLREPGSPRGALWKTSGFYFFSQHCPALWSCKWLKTFVQLYAVCWKCFPLIIVGKVALSLPLSENTELSKNWSFLSEDVTLVRVFNGIIYWVDVGISDVATAVSEVVD